MTGSPDPRDAFIDACFWHGSVDRANEILGAHPEIASSDIYTAAMLGNDAAVRRFLQADPASATAKGGPRKVDALTYLCFSSYLPGEPARSEGMVRTATMLLDAGASANTGFWEENHQPKPEWEPVLYGAAGVAHHHALTRLLLERGANPTDDEVVYHSPEGYDNRAMQLIVETGKLSDDDLSLMLVRKHDWHDYAGAKWLLEHGASPGKSQTRGWNPLHHALSRDNDLEMIELLLDHGADPTITEQGRSAVMLAARRGRSDVLDLFERRGIAFELAGPDRLIAACARSDASAIRAIAEREPDLVRQVVAEGGKLLAEFAGTGNVDGVRQLLDLGVSVDAVFADGDGYWDEARNSTALHVAAWRAYPAIVKLLLARGANVDAKDGKGRTPLMLAVKACVDSYWTERRTPESVGVLLAAGASRQGVKYPSGYAEVDDLLRSKT